MERIDEFLGKGKLDVIIVYGISSKVLVPAPGDRANARMVPKAYFRDFGLEDDEGSYYLRKDAILGIFVINNASRMPDINLVALQELRREERREVACREELDQTHEQLKAHSERVGKGSQLLSVGKAAATKPPVSNGGAMGTI